MKSYYTTSDHIFAKNMNSLILRWFRKVSISKVLFYFWFTSGIAIEHNHLKTSTFKRLNQ